jgi:hypothetical protein
MMNFFFSVIIYLRLAILSINDLLLLDLFRPFSSSFLSKQLAKWKTSPPSPQVT